MPEGAEPAAVDQAADFKLSSDWQRTQSFYRRFFAIPEDVQITPDMVRLHWTVERRGTVAILSSNDAERAKTAERAYSDLYRLCPWLNQANPRPTSTEVEFGPITGLLGDAKRIYEVGSGKGQLISWLASLGYVCVATEITSTRGENQQQSGGALSWHVSDGVHLDEYEPAASQDAILSIQVLEHLHPDDVATHFRSAHTVLAPGGCYLLATPHCFGGPKDLSLVFGFDIPVCMHLKEWSYRELRAHPKITESLGAHL